MVSVPIDLFRQDSKWFARAFDLALRRNDAEELEQILTIVADMFHQLGEMLDEKYGDGSMKGLGTRRKYKWEGRLPEDVMRDLEGSKIINEEWIGKIKKAEKMPAISQGARRMAERERKKLESNLRNKIRDGRRWMIERWPGWWTPEAEHFYKDYL